MIRGGNWNNGANAGVFYFNGNNSRANVNWNVGFRSALALFVFGLRATAQQKQQGKRDAFPGRQGQDQRPCSLLAKVARGGGQTAEAGRSLISG